MPTHLKVVFSHGGIDSSEVVTFQVATHVGHVISKQNCQQDRFLGCIVKKKTHSLTGELFFANWIKNHGLYMLGCPPSQ